MLFWGVSDPGKVRMSQAKRSVWACQTCFCAERKERSGVTINQAINQSIKQSIISKMKDFELQTWRILRSNSPGLWPMGVLDVTLLHWTWSGTFSVPKMKDFECQKRLKLVQQLNQKACWRRLGSQPSFWGRWVTPNRSCKLPQRPIRLTGVVNIAIYIFDNNSIL